MFIGRKKQLQHFIELCEQLENTDRRGGGWVLVEGMSGIGKSTFAEECLHQVGSRQMLTARGAYRAQIRREPLAPFFDLLDELLQERFIRRRVLPLLNDRAYRPLLSRLPLTATIMGADLRGTAADLPEGNVLPFLIASLLAPVAYIRPIVLLIDDVQWMPEEDQRLLAAVSEGLNNAPVMMLATMRSESESVPTLRTTLAPLLLDRIVLPPLSAREAGELITGLYGAQVSTRISTDIARVSNGLAFRIMELLRVLQEHHALKQDASGNWRVSPEYPSLISAVESISDERLRRLAPEERRTILLLDCAGGIAKRSELREWCTAIDSGFNEQSWNNAIEQLVQLSVIRSAYADPDAVVFAHDRIGEAQRRLRSADDIRSVAQMIVSLESARKDILRWSFDSELFAAIIRSLDSLPANDREGILVQLIGMESVKGKAQNVYPWDEINRILCAEDSGLSVVERARTLLGMLARYSQTALVPLDIAEEFHKLTLSDDECSSLRSYSCIYLANAYLNSGSASNADLLLEQAAKELDSVSDPYYHLGAELLMEEMSSYRASADPQKALVHVQRAYQLSQQIDPGSERSHELLAYITLYSARCRMREEFRIACTEFLNLMTTATNASSISFVAVFTAIRSALTLGEIALARRIFETWSTDFTVLGAFNYIGYCSVASLIAYNEGEAEVAAESAMSGFDEYRRSHPEASSPLSIWHDLRDFAPIQLLAVSSMILANMHTKALEFVDMLLADSTPSPQSDPYPLQMLNIYRHWLEWRAFLPDNASVLLWNIPEAQSTEIPQASRNYSSSEEAAEGFFSYARQALKTEVVVPPIRYTANLYTATIACWNGNFGQALEALQGAAEANNQLYSWSQETELLIASVTVRLRWVANDAERADELLPDVLDTIRTLFMSVAEKGLARRLEQLMELFRLEASHIHEQGSDLMRQIERIGAMAQTMARTVLENSTSDTNGPNDRTRLFVMGPLRLMKPFSYIELSNAAFERETARTLLMALSAAALTGKRISREELASRIAPKAKTPEQQKKALYNAASAARAACGSVESITLLGSNSMEINTDLSLESGVWIDALEIVNAIRHAKERERMGMSRVAFDEYKRALVLARKGDFASDCYEEWVDQARDIIRDTVRTATLAFAELTLRNGLYPDGIEALTAQLARDPLDEECHRALMLLYAESGNRTAALRQYDRCAALIEKEYGTEPEEETIQLRERLVNAGRAEG